MNEEVVGAWATSQSRAVMYSLVVAAVGSQLVLSAEHARLTRLGFAFVLAVHALEFACVRGTLRQDTSVTMRQHFVGTLLFGTTYWSPIKQRIDKARLAL
jgi:uncharacterized protein YhhL (DUF1145 family)